MSSFFKDKSDYLKTVAHNNKLIADGRPLNTGSAVIRKSFHRLNGEDELNTACVNFAHFPCVVHAGYNIVFRQPGTGLPRRVNGTTLYFLSKCADNLLSDSIELAKDEAAKAMIEYCSFLNEEMENNNVCGGGLFIFDMNKAQASEVGPKNSNLYGWRLYFEDESNGNEFKYDATKWF